MNLNFNLEVDDWLAFQKDYLKKNKSVRVQKLIVAILFPLIAIIWTLLKGNYNSLLIVLILSLIWIIISPRLINFKILNNIREELSDDNNKDVLGQQEMELTNEGVLFKTKNATSKMNWDAIVSISNTKKYFFLYNSSLSAIIIPKQKVSDISSIEALIKKYTKN